MQKGVAENSNYSERLLFWNLLTRITPGITFEFEVKASADYDTAVNTKMAAGRQLPDLLLLPMADTDPMKYASSGLIIPLDELIAKDAPDIQKLYNETPGLKSQLICRII